MKINNRFLTTTVVVILISVFAFSFTAFADEVDGLVPETTEIVGDSVSVNLLYQKEGANGGDIAIKLGETPLPLDSVNEPYVSVDAGETITVIGTPFDFMKLEGVYVETESLEIIGDMITATDNSCQVTVPSGYDTIWIAPKFSPAHTSGLEIDGTGHIYSLTTNKFNADRSFNKVVKYIAAIPNEGSSITGLKIVNSQTSEEQDIISTAVTYDSNGTYTPEAEDYEKIVSIKCFKSGFKSSSYAEANNYQGYYEDVIVPRFTSENIKIFRVEVPYAYDSVVKVYTSEVSTDDSVNYTKLAASKADYAGDINEESTFVLKSKTFTYTGSPITFSVDVFRGSKLLAEDVDYTLKFYSNKAAGDGAYAQITGKGTYAGKSIKIPFTIEKYDISEDSFVIPEELYFETVDKSKTINPKLNLYINGIALKKGVDYTLTPDGNIPMNGDSTLKVTGIGNLKGTRTIKLHFVEKGSALLLSRAKISGVKALKYKDGGYDCVSGNKVLDAFPKLKVKMKKTTLVLGQDYEASINGSSMPGVAALTITAIKGNAAGYVGSKTYLFKIKPVAFKKVSCKFVDPATAKSGYKFEGSAITPEIIVQYEGKDLTYGKDYTVSYKKNGANSKKGQIIIKGIGGFKGTKKLKFKIIK